jgi:tetratricopeptide (TPR) repeat protein
MHNTIESLEQAQSSTLETAWQRYAQLATNASSIWRQYLRLRGFSVALTIVATLLAILSIWIDDSIVAPPIAEIFRACLILVPLVNAVILVFANKLQQGQHWQILSTGAQEIKKEIFLYRTLLQGQATRHQWLSDRIIAIQRRVIEAVGEGIALNPYTGNVPPDDSPEGQNGDPAFSDLLADDYLRYRLEAQLRWYSQECERLSATRTRLQIGIFALTGLSAFIAGWGRILEVWVAFSLALGTALTVWLEVSRIDERVSNYNQLILELNLIRDRWQSLSLQEQTAEEFFKLVMATEKVLWSLHNKQIAQMHQAVADLQDKTGDLLTQVMSKPASIVVHQPLLKQQQPEQKTLVVEAEVLPKKAAENEVVKQPKEAPKTTNTKGLPHAFVVMPFGRKKGPDGRWIDFNAIYQQLIKPALEEAGFESFRADEEAVSGDILTDMFQELLLADLVLTDLSIDNANVFYELGVRHALRKRGLVHIQCGRSYMPYDIFNVRTLPYNCDENGRPDPQHLEKDKQAIVKMARATWESDQNRIHSPIFQLLAGLEEPDRKALRTPLATGYWQEYKQWQERVAIAKRQKRIGDVLLLTEEVRNPLIKEDAIADAGKALKDLGNHALALKEYRQGLKLNSNNSVFRREEAFHLSRLKQTEEACVKLEGLLRDEPTNIEALCCLAHIYKEAWQAEWMKIASEQECLKAAYEATHLLKKSIETYLKAYRLNQSHYYSGINALTLSAVLDHLAQQVGEDGDPEEEALRQQLPALTGALQFCLESATKHESNDFWLFMSLGELAVCTASNPKQVTRAYKKALTLAGKSKFALKSPLAQLKLLEKLSFRPDNVKAGIAVLQEELKRVEEQERVVASDTDDKPAQVILFSGHMIDSPNRAKPRFPAKMEDEARQKIEQALDKLKAGSNCMAIVPGAACGGDILFLEACLQRNMKVEVFLPFEPAKFIQGSVSFAGDDWVRRFYAIQNHPNLTIHLQTDRLGQVPEGDCPYERNNRWALYSTLMYGIERVRLIALWDGKGGDGSGGTNDMVQQVRQLGGVVEHLDTTHFDYWKGTGKVVDFAKAAEMSGLLSPANAKGIAGAWEESASQQ